MKKFSLILFTFILIFNLFACSNGLVNPNNNFEKKDPIDDSQNANDDNKNNDETLDKTDENDPPVQSPIEFSNSALYTDYLTENFITVDLNTLVQDSYTISTAGIFVLSGYYSGSIIVDAKKCDVRVVLNNAQIVAKSGSPFVVLNAKSLAISLPPQTQNTLTDTATYAYASGSDFENVNACLYCKDDLILNGTGSLNIVANFNNGIKVNDTFTASDVNLVVNAVGNGIKVNDSIQLLRGNYSITSTGDAIQCENDDDLTLGSIEISDSTIEITSGEDGIQAYSSLKIFSGDITIKTAKGSGYMISSSATAKGLKAENSLEILGGNFDLDCGDDAIHSNNTLSILGGTLEIKSADDGIHATSVLSIESGKINITKSYEGIEGEKVNILGGEISVVASDDGINAPGGSGKMQANASSKITISGGTIYVNSNSDGLDSNGDILVNGGILLVNSNASNDPNALDCDGNIYLNGGTVIAVGGTQMVHSPSNSSTQATLHCHLTATQNANVALGIFVNDEFIGGFVPQRAYRSIIISSPTMSVGDKIELFTGGTLVGENIFNYYQTTANFGGTSQVSTTLSANVTTYNLSSGGGGFRPR